jgi:crotonobetainyl-CoA:carnitine CoA-transferase CaiB-like acyl-CoA transferase
MVGEARDPETETGPLDGLVVLDASRVLVGPFCTMQLGDLGADVIKVERPGVGDQTRGWHPPTYGESGESAYYLSINRNKRSIELNLNTDEGQAVFSDLASEADVVVENFRVGTMEAWGLGYEELCTENSGLIYAKLSGYGEWGPDRDEPAYDIMMQARSGLMSITGEEDGDPVRVGVAIADIGAGMYATQAILAALLERELGTGQGQKVDVSLLDSQVAWMSYQALNYFATQEPPGRMGSKHPNLAPYQAFETANGFVIVAVSSENIWPRFCRALDREDLITDERFETNADRVEQMDSLEEILAAEFSNYETDDLLDVLEEHGVPASDVQNMAEVFADPQVQARNMYATIEHPTAGTVEMPGSPMHLSRTPATINSYPPHLGEHTEEVLREYNYTDSDIGHLREIGAIPHKD